MAGKLLVIAAPSGCGKTTIVKQILHTFDNFYFSISATTRVQRKNEKHGKDYYFISREEFDKKIAEDDFVEWNEHFGNRYGTLKSDINRQINEGKDIIFDVDVNGALNIKKNFPESKLIFIKAPDINTLRERLVKRGSESEETIDLRLKRAEEEIEKSVYFDEIIINDKLDTAIEDIKKIIYKFIK